MMSNKLLLLALTLLPWASTAFAAPPPARYGGPSDPSQHDGLAGSWGSESYGHPPTNPYQEPSPGNYPPQKPSTPEKHPDEIPPPKSPKPDDDTVWGNPNGPYPPGQNTTVPPATAQGNGAPPPGKPSTPGWALFEPSWRPAGKRSACSDVQTLHSKRGWVVIQYSVCILNHGGGKIDMLLYFIHAQFYYKFNWYAATKVAPFDYNIKGTWTSPKGLLPQAVEYQSVWAPEQGFIKIGDVAGKTGDSARFEWDFNSWKGTFYTKDAETSGHGRWDLDKIPPPGDFTRYANHTGN